MTSSSNVHATCIWNPFRASVFLIKARPAWRARRPDEKSHLNLAQANKDIGKFLSSQRDPNNNSTLVDEKKGRPNTPLLRSTKSLPEYNPYKRYITGNATDGWRDLYKAFEEYMSVYIASRHKHQKSSVTELEESHSEVHNESPLYMMPNTPEEASRLRDLHYYLRAVFDDYPVFKDSLKPNAEILDVGQVSTTLSSYFAYPYVGNPNTVSHPRLSLAVVQSLGQSMWLTTTRNVMSRLLI